MESIILPLIFTAIGISLSWFYFKAKIAGAVDQGRAKYESEITALREKCIWLETQERKNDDQICKLVQENNSLKNTLSETRASEAQLREKSSRIPSLELKQQDLQKSNEMLIKSITDYREQIGRISSDNSSIQAKYDDLVQKNNDLMTRLNDAENKCSNLTNGISIMQERMSNEKSSWEEKIKLLDDAKNTLTNQFESLANKILEDKTKRFTEQNQQNISNILDPLKTKINEFQQKVEVTHSENIRERATLKEQIQNLLNSNLKLNDEAKNLTTALKGSSKVQGDLGEIQLNKILEDCGLKEGQEYNTQKTHTGNDNERQRPDVVIRMPGDRSLIVDSKMSLKSYLEYSQSDESTRNEHLNKLVTDIEKHVKDLSQKNYASIHGINSIDFVVMFLPIEGAILAAATQKPSLYLDAYNKNVLLVGPSTLLFVVKIVNQLWQQDRQHKNVEEIVEKAKRIYEKISAFVEDLQSIGDRIRQASDSHVSAMTKLTGRGNVITLTESLVKMGVSPSPRRRLSKEILNQANISTDDGSESDQDEIEKIDSLDIQKTDES